MATTKPKRIQRRRAKGWRLSEGAVCVTRPGPWGNPFETAEEFRSMLVAVLKPYGSFDYPMVSLGQFARMSDIARRLHELRGKSLACWCPLDKPCHADVLIELANRR